MKKQILTLTMCLALTATSALAAGTKAVATKAITKTKVTTTVKAPAKAIATAKAKTAPVQNITKSAEQPQLSPQEEGKKRFEARRMAERERMYNDLGLSAEQKTKAEALNAKTREGAGAVIKKVQVEHKKLRDLKAKHASVFAVWKQKQALKAAKKDADKYFNESRKALEAILTDAQKAKLKVIDAERRAKMEKFRKSHKPGPQKMGPKPEGPQLMGPPPGHEGPHGPAPIAPPPKAK